MKKRTKLTEKQKNLLGVIIKGNPDGTLCDIDQILDKIAYTTTKESLQFSLRFLVERELIRKAGLERRRGRLRITYQAMSDAYRVLREY